MLKTIVWVVGPLLLIAAFGRKHEAQAAGGGQYGAPGFDSTTVIGGTGVRVTGASFVKVGSEYYDANTGAKISRAEAAARAKAEGMVLP